MLLKNSYCTEPCCDVCMERTPEAGAEAPKNAVPVHRSLYVAPWAKIILAILIAALLIAGLFAFITAQAVWNADIETMNVTVYDTEGMAHTLPGLAFDGALFVDAQAYDEAIAARHDGTLSVSPKYWGEQRLYELNENGELKVN